MEGHSSNIHTSDENYAYSICGNTSDSGSKIIVLSDERVNILPNIHHDNEEEMEESVEYLNDNLDMQEEYIDYCDEDEEALESGQPGDEGLAAVKRANERKEISVSGDQPEYITTEDDPIAEFLKIPIKSYTKNQASYNKHSSSSRLMSQIFSIQSPNYSDKLIATSDAPCTSEEVSLGEDKEKEDIYLKVVKTLEMLMCDVCNQMFSNKHFLDQHKAVHTKYVVQNKYFCKYCNLRRFSKVTGLLGHIAKSHKTAKFYNCTICQQDFTKQAQFSMHIKDVHQNTQGKFKFDSECGLIVYKMQDESHSSAETSRNLTEDIQEQDIDQSQNIATNQLLDQCASKEPQLTLHLSDDSGTDSGESKNTPSLLVPISSKAVVVTPGSRTPSKSSGYNPCVVLERVDNPNGEVKSSILERHGLVMKKNRKCGRGKRRTRGKSTRDKDEHQETLKKTNSNVVIRVKSNHRRMNHCRRPETLRHRCHFCSRRFKDGFAFHLHIKTHFEEDSHLCVCGVRLATQELFEEHKYRYHSNNHIGNILLMKLNEHSYRFIQQSSSSTIQGTLTKVNRHIQSPLKVFQVPKNNEFMGDVEVALLVNPRQRRSTALEAESGNVGIAFSRIPPEQVSSDVKSNTIKMILADTSFKEIKEPFRVKSTYVDPNIDDRMYDGVTHVTKLFTKATESNFTLLYDTCSMPSVLKSHEGKQTTPSSCDADQDTSNVILVSANPLAHLMAPDTLPSRAPKVKKNPKKTLDYESIIRKNLANMLNVKPINKK